MKSVKELNNNTCKCRPKISSLRTTDKLVKESYKCYPSAASPDQNKVGFLSSETIAVKLFIGVIHFTSRV